VTGIVLAAQAQSLAFVLAGFALWGVCNGGMMPINELIWSSYFGRRYIGAVRGTALPFSIMFSALGPLIAGTYYDAVGSYDGAILTFCALWVVAALLVLLARPPTKRTPAPQPRPALVAGDDAA
jgi:MFS family permease